MRSSREVLVLPRPLPTETGQLFTTSPPLKSVSLSCCLLILIQYSPAFGDQGAAAQAAAALTKIKTNAVINILFIKTLQFLHNFFYYNTNSVLRHSIVYLVFFRKNTFNGNLLK